MKIIASKYQLKLKHQFSISYNSRKTTPVVIIKIEDKGIAGFGEACLPPYLLENQETVLKFLSRVNLRDIDSSTELENFLEEIDSLSENDNAAKTAIDIALHDYLCKKLNISLSQLYNINVKELPYTSFTIGIDKRDIIQKKILEADEFKYLKIKLGTKDDKLIIKTIREITDKPLYVDVNQGWKDEYFALEMINWLKEQNVLLIEQPMPVDDIESAAFLKENSPLPIIADESVKRIYDIEKVKDFYSGINIKLMKSTGINEAYEMIHRAHEYGLKVMLSCMTETSCGITAAAHLSPLVDYVDLDGNLLIQNDPFEGCKIDRGKLVLNKLPGLGIRLIKNLFVD